jgi:hypothetical protein
MYLYGEGLVSCKNLFPIQLYIYIDNKIIIKYRFKLHRYLVDETVKSVWIRQVFGLLRVRFRQVSLYKIWSSILEIKTMAMLQVENGHIMLITHNIYYTKNIFRKNAPTFNIWRGAIVVVIVW